MYWRVKKIGPKEILRQYGIHAALAISLLCNMFFFFKLSAKQNLNKQQQTQFDTFARQVTQHLLDSSYLTYDDSMTALLNGELSKDVIASLMKSEDLPKSVEESKAISRELFDKKMVSTVHIESVNVSPPDPSRNSFVPVEVKAQVVGHSAEGLEGPQTLRFSYLVGMVQSKDGGEQRPIITNITRIVTPQQN